MSGLSKVYRACGYRVGWASFSGDLENAREYPRRRSSCCRSLRLCSNVPGQWAVQTALGGYQSIRELVAPGGRLYESRRAIVEAVAAQPLPHAHAADGRAVRVRRRERRAAAGIRRPARSRSTCSSTSTCWSRRARVSTCRTGIISASRTCPSHGARRRVRAHRRTARKLCSRRTAGGQAGAGAPRRRARHLVQGVEIVCVSY